MEDLSRRPVQQFFQAQKVLTLEFFIYKNSQQVFRFQPQAMNSLFSNCHVGNVQVFMSNNYLDPLFCCFYGLKPNIRILCYFCQATFQLIDVLTSLCFINQSNIFKHSYKRSDWSNLACIIRVYRRRAHAEHQS